MAQEIGENTAAFEAHFAFHRERRPPSYWLITLIFAAGFGLSVGARTLVGELAPPEPNQHERAAPSVTLAQGIKAYESQDFSAAVGAFERVLAAVPDHARSLDYLDRIALTQLDAERLGKAEEALVAGQADKALAYALAVPPSSLLFAQAETLARSAAGGPSTQHKAPSADRQAGGLTGAKAALLEALALYRDGKFVEAVARAEDLSQKAQGDTQQELAGWAADARAFAEQYRQLPPDAVGRAREAEQTLRLIELDERLSDGHYARPLRETVEGELVSNAEARLSAGDVPGSCSTLRVALRFDTRRSEALRARCEGEALLRLERADAARAADPAKAVGLAREALALAPPGSEAFIAAQRALAH